jgi:hypothetical protein
MHDGSAGSPVKVFGQKGGIMQFLYLLSREGRPDDPLNLLGYTPRQATENKESSTRQRLRSTPSSSIIPVKGYCD